VWGKGSTWITAPTGMRRIHWHAQAAEPNPCNLQEKEKTTQAVKNTPRNIKGKGATLVLGTVKHLDQRTSKKINGNLEGCVLDLKPELSVALIFLLVGSHFCYNICM